MPTRRYVRRFKKRSRLPRKNIKALVRSEVKRSTWGDLSYIDTSGFNRSLGYDSAFVQHITGIPDGSLPGERTGNKIIIHQVSVNFQVYKPPEAVVNLPALVRFVLVRVNTDAAPTVSRLWNATVSQTDVTAFRNPTLAHDFTILKQWDIDLGANTSSTGNYNSRNTYNVKFHRKFKNPVKVQFAGPAATDIAVGQMYLLAYSNYIAAATGPRLNQWHSRVIYSQ